MDKSSKSADSIISAVSSNPSTSQNVSIGPHGKKITKAIAVLAKYNSPTLNTSKDSSGNILYKKLVVPSSMRSAYWKYFGFPAADDGSILSKLKIICILCKTQISYNRNTSNLRMHLQNKHKEELAQLEIENPPKVLKPKSLIITSKSKGNSKEVDHHYIYTDMENSVDNNIQFLTNGVSVSTVPDFAQFDDQNDVNELIQINSTNISEAIADFVIMGLQQPEVVEEKGFQRLIATLQSPCEIPSKATLVHDIVPKMYETYKAVVIDGIESCSGHFGLSIEEWNLVTGETYVTFGVHYLTNEDDLFTSKILTSLLSPSNADTEFWTNALDSIFKEWKIPSQNIVAVISAAKIKPLLDAIKAKDIIIVPCLVATLQDICSKCCFELENVAEIIRKCRKLMACINKNASCLAALRMEEHISQVEESNFSSDYPPVWISTYSFLEACLARKEAIPVALENSDLTISERGSVIIDDSEWAIVEDIINVLDPFKITMMTLSEEKTPLISLIRPLLWQLISSHLKVKDSDTEFAKSLKESLSKALEKCYEEENIKSLLLVATAVDPRFKLLQCCTEDGNFTVLEEKVKGLLTTFISKEGSQKCNTDDEPTPKKSRLSGMEFLLGEVYLTKSDIGAGERASHEIFQFQSEPSAHLDDCPLTWWKKASNRCPNLAKLVRQYNCLPASALPSNRIPVDAQVSFHIKRQSLSADIVDKLLFLNSNHIVKDGVD